MARLGKVKYSIEYVVDLDNEAMVDHAREAIVEDLTNAYKYCELNAGIQVEQDDCKTLDEGDIPEFLRANTDDDEFICTGCKGVFDIEDSIQDGDELYCPECYEEKS